MILWGLYAFLLMVGVAVATLFAQTLTGGGLALWPLVLVWLVVSAQEERRT